MRFARLHQRFLKEGRQPFSRAVALLCLVQFLPSAQGAQAVAGNGGGCQRPALVDGRYRGTGRGKGAKAGMAGALQKNMSVTVEYKVHPNSWSDCIIAVDSEVIRLEASSFTDALDDLLRATRGILEAGIEATATFMDLPGESRLKLLPLGDRLLIRVLRFDDTFSRELDADGELVAEVECRLRTFAGAVLAAAQTVHREIGIHAYRTAQRYDFPVDQMAALQAALHRTKISN